MQLNKVRELFESATAFKTNPAFAKLSECFEELARLRLLHKEGLADASHYELFKEWSEQFWLAFNEAVSGLGLDPEELKANLNNPYYFKPEQWKLMQQVRQEVTGESVEETAPVLKLKKKRKKKV